MRQIATLPNESAQTFADYLLTRKIRTQLLPENDGVGVWVCDEDQVAQARQELAEFTGNPSDPRFHQAGAVAESMRRQEERVEAEYNQLQRRLEARMRGLSGGRLPVTITLMVISIAVALASKLGADDQGRLLQKLHIASWTQERVDGHTRFLWHHLDEIRAGQVWRLVTPIFIHYGVIHLLFNMLMLLSLGGAVEARRGSLRYLLLVLVLAVGSNLAQYYLGHTTFDDGRLVLKGSPAFGGMSGVLYGLFGYAWMKSRYEPALGLNLTRDTVVILLVWFFLCLLGIVFRAANGAHAGGLLLGIVIGLAPTWWRWLRGGQLDV
jgi:GlpG protein